MNRRHARADPLEDPLRVGQREFAVVGGVQRADPRVEHLNGVDAGVDLRDEIVADDVGELFAEAMPRIGMAVHQRLGLGEVVRMPAFDRVRRQRERRAGKPDQRHASVQLALDLADRGEHVRERFARLEQLQPIDVRGVVDRPLDLRPFALDEIEGQSHRLERQQQIGEQDGRVDVDAADRLQRDFGGEVGLAADVEQRMTRSRMARYSAM